MNYLTIQDCDNYSIDIKKILLNSTVTSSLLILNNNNKNNFNNFFYFIKNINENLIFIVFHFDKIVPNNFINVNSYYSLIIELIKNYTDKITFKNDINNLFIHIENELKKKINLKNIISLHILFIKNDNCIIVNLGTIKTIFFKKSIKCFETIQHFKLKKIRNKISVTKCFGNFRLKCLDKLNPDIYEKRINDIHFLLLGTPEFWKSINLNDIEYILDISYDNNINIILKNIIDTIPNKKKKLKKKNILLILIKLRN